MADRALDEARRDHSGSRHVLIIGASSSIGSAVAERFRVRGARVLETYQSRPRPTTSGASAVQLDLTSTESLDRFTQDAIPRFGRVDVLIFAAGILPGKSLTSYDDNEIDEVMSVNIVGQVKLIKRMIPYLNNGSQIIMIASISGQRGSYDPVYAASKSAVLGLVRSLATWLAPAIRANAVAPGLVEGSMMYGAFTPERRARHLAEIPMRRFLTAEEVGAAIYDIAEPHWSHLNGACIDLNGGQYVR